MKFLALTDHYPPYEVGGYEIDCYHLVNGLCARGHEVLVLTTNIGLDHPESRNGLHRTLHLLQPSANGRLGARIKHLHLAFQAQLNYWRTKRLAMSFAPDMVLVWHMQGTTVLPILAAQDLGLPLLFRLASHWLIQDKQYYFGEPSRIKRNYRSMLLGYRSLPASGHSLGVFTSNSLQGSYRKAGIHFGASTTVPNGLTEEWLTTGGKRIPEKRTLFRALFAGRLEAAKGPETAIRAMELLLRKCGRGKASLDLIGRGTPEYIRYLRTLIEELGLSEAVHLKGYMPREELRQQYRFYDILLFPTPEWEGFGMTIMEAMSQGVPAIASDIGGPRDIITNRMDGFLVPPNDPETMAQTMNEIFESPLLQSSLSENGISMVQKKYGMNSIIEQFEDVILHNISSGSKSR